MNDSNNQLTRLVILFLGRSGSTYLKESLNSHSKIYIQDEFLVGKKWNKQRQDLERLFNRVPSPDSQIVGVKTKLKDIHNSQQFTTFLKEMNTKIICLTRRNQVKRIVSLARAIELNEFTGKWNLYNKEERVGKIRIDVERFKSWLSHSELEKKRLLNYVKTLKLPTLYLEYEDLLLEQTATFERIFQFIGVESQKLGSKCVKHTNDNLREEIENFDELYSYYINTPYQAMFDEVVLSSN
jgi:LPS sulfotransferase NodH